MNFGYRYKEQFGSLIQPGQLSPRSLPGNIVRVSLARPGSERSDDMASGKEKNMANVIIVGTQWGDEGKGKVVDLLSERADFIVRFQGETTRDTLWL